MHINLQASSSPCLPQLYRALLLAHLCGTFNVRSHSSGIDTNTSVGMWSFIPQQHFASALTLSSTLLTSFSLQTQKAITFLQVQLHSQCFALEWIKAGIKPNSRFASTHHCKSYHISLLMLIHVNLSCSISVLPLASMLQPSM